MSPEQVARGVYAPDEGITGTVLKHAHMIVADDVRNDPLFLGRTVLREDMPPEQTMFIALPTSRPQPHLLGVLRLPARPLQPPPAARRRLPC